MTWMFDARGNDGAVGGDARRVANKSKPAATGHHSELLTASEAVGDLVPVRTAVISVSDKSGLEQLGVGLSKYSVHAIATEGSADYLRSVAKGLKLTGLSEYTRFPENLNGRLKTLHPKLQAGVLAIKKFHDTALEKIDAQYIDLVVVNLYPFEKTVRSGASAAECIENIDIGGPALLRAGAKNHPSVCVISDVNDYSALLGELNRNKGSTSLAFRRRCAQKVFELTSKYDASIAAWFQSNQ